jgi:Tfp pilus assembly protein PilO
MKLSQRDTMIVAGVAILLVAVAFVILAIVPQFRQLGKQDKDMAQADADIASARQLLAARQEAKAQAAQTQAMLTRLENQIPDAPELAALIIDLQDTANDAGVAWDLLQPAKPVVTSGNVQRIELAFSITGRWDDIIDYLRRLNELERAVRILNVDLSPSTAAASTTTSGTAASAMQLSAHLTIDVYSLARQSTTGAAPSAGP